MLWCGNWKREHFQQRLVTCFASRIKEIIKPDSMDGICMTPRRNMRESVKSLWVIFELISHINLARTLFNQALEAVVAKRELWSMWYLPEIDGCPCIIPHWKAVESRTLPKQRCVPCCVGGVVWCGVAASSLRNDVSYRKATRLRVQMW